jgi:hypothetical protein
MKSIVMTYVMFSVAVSGSTPTGGEIRLLDHDVIEPGPATSNVSVM